MSLVFNKNEGVEKLSSQLSLAAPRFQISASEVVPDPRGVQDVIKVICRC